MNLKDKKIADIKNIIKTSKIDEYPKLIEELKSDSRTGVNKLALSLIKKVDAHKKEVLRIKNIKGYEESLYEKGYKYIAGIDEVGRGPLAGPVVSAAVILPRDSQLLYVNDSKKLNKKKREELCDEIKKEALAIGIGVVDNKEIDSYNILEATKMSMLKAISELKIKPDIILIDALEIDTKIKQKAFIKGDENIYSIAAASIVAKVYRDNIMDEYHDKYPEYDFASNKGYGTAVHMGALSEKGACEIHRKTFIKNITGELSSSLGKEYEDVAVNFLKKRGMTVLERNYNISGGEIDIIAREKDSLVFIEVKGRKDKEHSPKESVTKEKQERIAKAAENYINEKNLQDKACRFDVIEINKDRGLFDINYLKNSFYIS